MSTDADTQDPMAIQGYEAMRRGDWAAGGALLAQAAAACEDERALALWFDAALAFKFRRDWPRALDLGREAAARAEPGTQSPVFWNLGVAATALRDWATARRAWSDYGIAIKPGEGEIREGFGMTPIRLHPQAGDGEVVVTDRICPARAIVREIPSRCGRRFGDVLLHDGAPVDTVSLGGRDLMVFDEIAVWQESDIPAWSAQIEMDGDGHDRLDTLFGKYDYIEDREISCRTAAPCTCCDRDGSADHATARLQPQEILLAASEERLRDLLEQWVREEPERRSYRDLTLLVRTAGK